MNFDQIAYYKLSSILSKSRTVTVYCAYKNKNKIEIEIELQFLIGKVSHRVSVFFFFFNFLNHQMALIHRTNKLYQKYTEIDDRKITKQQIPFLFFFVRIRINTVAFSVEWIWTRHQITISWIILVKVKCIFIEMIVSSSNSIWNEHKVNISTF